MVQSRPPSSDYSGWSADFLELCRSQLDLLLGTIPDLTEAAVFFRRERSCGALEFVPIAVASVGVERIWIAHPHVDGADGAGGGAEAELSARTSFDLPGGVPAIELVPSYPAISDEVLTLPDGALCVPVEYNSAIAGNVVLWRPHAGSHAGGYPQAQARGLWSAREVASARVVARSIAIAAALEGKNSALERARVKAFEMMESAHTALGVAVHQIRSPITALVTFGHVLLRKLPPGDELRQLAKSIVVEAMRLDVLLQPVENVRSQLAIEAGEQSDADKQVKVANSESGKSDLLLEQQAYNVSTKGIKFAKWEQRRMDVDGEKRLVLDQMQVGNDDGSSTTADSGDTADSILLRSNENEIIVNQPVVSDVQVKMNGYEDVEFRKDFQLDDDFEDDLDEFDDLEDDDGDSDDTSKELARYEAALSDVALWTTPTTRISGSDSGGGGGQEASSLLWLTDVVEPLVGTFSVLASEAGHTLHVLLDRDAPAVRADADRVREAVYNLLHNAVSYTPAGGHVGVVVVGTHIIVWDTGVGVRQEDKLRIWEHGQRAIQIPQGQGIGLAVVRSAATPAICSPIPPEWDPRQSAPPDTLAGAAFMLRFQRS